MNNPNKDVVEQFFIDHGRSIAGYLVATFVIALIYLLVLYILRNKSEKSKLKISEIKGVAENTGNTKTRFLQTPEGMSIALITGTVLTCGIGIALVAIYKWAGFNDDFGQGSGSLIQAIWGSAATITAAVVAIMLALEAIAQAKKTNDLQVTANAIASRQADADEAQLPLQQTWDAINACRLAIDELNWAIKPILNATNGIIKDDVTHQVLAQYFQRISESLLGLSNRHGATALDSIKFEYNLGENEKTYRDIFGIKNYLNALYIFRLFERRNGPMFNFIKSLSPEDVELSFMAKKSISHTFDLVKNIPDVGNSMHPMKSAALSTLAALFKNGDPTIKNYWEEISRNSHYQIMVIYPLWLVINELTFNDIESIDKCLAKNQGEIWIFEQERSKKIEDRLNCVLNVVHSSEEWSALKPLEQFFVMAHRDATPQKSTQGKQADRDNSENTDQQ